jgi:hypothetical protein
MSEIRDYQVDHLLLLVGSNPVPNVVAGKLLTTPKDTITLIHSADDGLELAKRLRAWFARAGYSEANISLREIRESDAVSVSNCVQDVLEKYRSQLLRERNSNTANEVGTIRIGLNYTGGTKVMAVHAYLALKNWVENRAREALFDRYPVFSYLDARTLELRFEQVGMRPPTPFYTGRKVSLSIHDLLDLHNWEPIKDPIKEPVLPESAKTLLAIHRNRGLTKLWNEWLKEELLPKNRNSQAIPWPHLPKLQEAMSQELGQHDPQFLNLTTARGSGCKDEHDLRKWASGAWLESAVLSALQACSQELHLEEYCMDIQPKVRGSSEKEAFFQLDVAAIYGYQLFAFSCTTASGGKGDLKQKLFEANVRAQQIGGDEARSALVCYAEPKTVNALEVEMRRDIVLKGRIRVFGLEHLSNLAEHIKKWIIEQSGDRK